MGLFDRVLCDVPCSGFGVIRRKPEIKYKLPESIRNLPEIQYKILQTSSKYLKGGGTLVYSTCTLHPAENEAVVARFLEENTGFELFSQKTYTGEEFDADGFFLSVLQKR
jgi:16S rRNA (cytosine967-C5)-methyltransferase